MASNKSRLRSAEIKYGDALQEWLTNPKNEDLPNEVVDARLNAAFHAFLGELLQDEDACAEFIATKQVIDELEFLPLIFEHFKSEKIYKAIKSNCEAAFSHKYSIESEEMEKKRREMLSYMQASLEA